MKKLFGFLFLVFLISGLSSRPTVAQTTSSSSNQQQAYDTFNGPSIDPSKWLSLARTDPCRDSSNSMECVREIQGGKLRLMVTSYGARETNDGNQYGISNLVSAIQARKNMTVDMVVKKATATACSSNEARSEVHAEFSVPFFSVGSTHNTPEDNVRAVVVFQSVPWLPGYLAVYGTYEHLGWHVGQGEGLTVPVGTPVRSTIVWDQANNKFIATLINLQSGEQATMDVPYTEQVVAPADYWQRPILQVTAIPANCVAAPTSASVETTFDNVIIDR